LTMFSFTRTVWQCSQLQELFDNVLNYKNCLTMFSITRTVWQCSHLQELFDNVLNYKNCLTMFSITRTVWQCSQLQELFDKVVVTQLLLLSSTWEATLVIWLYLCNIMLFWMTICHVNWSSFCVMDFCQSMLNSSDC